VTFLAVWLAWSVFGIMVLCAAFVWAVRTGQFSQQERARSMAVEAGRKISGDRAGFIDRLAPAAIIVLFILAMGASLWVTYR
jgi:nitrogen fixation-related uncharacterized protein